MGPPSSLLSGAPIPRDLQGCGVVPGPPWTAAAPRESLGYPLHFLVLGVRAASCLEIQERPRVLAGSLTAVSGSQGPTEPSSRGGGHPVSHLPLPREGPGLSSTQDCTNTAVHAQRQARSVARSVPSTDCRAVHPHEAVVPDTLNPRDKHWLEATQAAGQAGWEQPHLPQVSKQHESTSKGKAMAKRFKKHLQEK